MSTDPDAVPGPVPGGPEGRATSSLWLATRPVAPRSAPFEPGRRYDTAVVGAGITGLATAVLLARAGQRVVLIEKSGIGAVTTGHTTAKLSLLQGLSLSRVRSHQGDEVLAAHVSANLAGQEWLLGFLDAHGVGYQRRTAYTYATTVAGEELLTDELAASRAAGLPVTRADDTGLPYEVRAAIQLPDQVQFHPMDVLAALLAEFESLGGVLHVGVRVHGLRMGTPCTVVTLAGDVDADHVVLATGTPIVDRGAHFARLKALRSYALALEVPGAPATIPQGMYLSVDEPVRTLRTVPLGDTELLIVGGQGHEVGRAATGDRYTELASWSERYFPGAVVKHAWSAQDYQEASGLPSVGRLPLTGGRVLAATGFDKWGLTNGVAAALRLTYLITGDQPTPGMADWADRLDRIHLGGPGAADLLRYSGMVAVEAALGWKSAEQRPIGDVDEGHGEIGRLGVRPAARSTVDGRTCTVSAVCTHLGGIVGWNDAEQTWDCPLHGSRFAPDGALIEGPAVDDLERLE